MISPTMRPCRTISASHSGQCAIVDSPFFFLKLHNCWRNVLEPGRRTNKNALRPQNCKGRRAITIALVVPPSFVDASRHQPCRVLTYSSPITGATGKGLLSQTRFLLAAPGFIHSALHMGFPPTAHSLDAPGTCYSSLRSFCLFSCNCVGLDITCNCTVCQ